MEGAADIDDFAQAPSGRFLTGRSWAHFCADESLFGVLLWGRPDREATQALTRSLLVELGPLSTRHDSLVDARLLEGVDSEAFDVLVGYVREHHRALSERVARLALVRPRSLAGAIAAGFYQVLEAPYPVEVFDELEPALTWLSPVRASLATELGEIIDRVTGAPPLIAALRARIAAEPRETDLRAAASAVGLSERSLQRRLRELGTTYQRLLTEARIDEAKKRLLDSAAPITRIAVDVGFSSTQHFSSAFRRQTGLSPSAWRQQRDKSHS